MASTVYNLNGLPRLLNLPWHLESVGKLIRQYKSSSPAATVLTGVYFCYCFNKRYIGSGENVNDSDSFLLLRDTGLTAGKIANECGFTGNVYFHQSFKKCFGVSPGRYRKSCFFLILNCPE